MAALTGSARSGGVGSVGSSQSLSLSVGFGSDSVAGGWAVDACVGAVSV